jgi:hypothetical protein
MTVTMSDQALRVRAKTYLSEADLEPFASGWRRYESGRPGFISLSNAMRLAEELGVASPDL